MARVLGIAIQRCSGKIVFYAVSNRTLLKKIYVKTSPPKWPCPRAKFATQSIESVVTSQNCGVAPCSVLWLTHVAGFISTLSTAPHRQLSFELLSQAPLPLLRPGCWCALRGVCFSFGQASVLACVGHCSRLAKHGDSSSREVQYMLLKEHQ